MSEGNSLAVMLERADLVLVDKNVRAQVIAIVQGEIERFQGDISTTGGRKEIASLAHKVTRTKTAIDNAGKALNEKARAQINEVDAVRREIRELFDSMRDHVRAPLTEWEVAEAERLQARDNTLRIINQAGIGIPGESTASISERAEVLKCIHIMKDVFQEGTDSANEALVRAKEHVWLLLELAKSEEAAQAELVRLRAETVARDKADRERAEARAAAERFRLKKEREAKAEAERIRAAELKAIAQADEKHKAELEDLKMAQRIKDLEAKEEHQRQADLKEKIEKEAKQSRESKAHREKVKVLVVKALVEEARLSLGESQKVFGAIDDGKVPFVKVVY